MSEWVALDPVNLDIVLNYISDTSRASDFTGYLNTCLHLQVPESLTWDTVTVSRDPETGQITLQQDPQKVQAKLDQAWADLRTERNRRLQASDWTVLTDAQTQKDAWFAYRQALRDLPSTVTDPKQVTWPSTP